MQTLKFLTTCICLLNAAIVFADDTKHEISLLKQRLEYLREARQQKDDGLTESSVPTGTVVAYAGTYEPLGWRFCDGSEVSRVAYGALFGIIGTTFGAGDGKTTISLPDFRSRFLLGGSSLSETGAAGGEVAVVLTIEQMPSHSHQQVHLASHGGNEWGPAYQPGPIDGVPTSYTGGSQAHNNMPPYVKIGWIIKT